MFIIYSVFKRICIVIFSSDNIAIHIGKDLPPINIWKLSQQKRKEVSIEFEKSKQYMIKSRR